ncbi:MAG: malto-oligosyltrehalose trehalohydrolase, partial [Moraxellaceae bacterium]
KVSVRFTDTAKIFELDPNAEGWFSARINCSVGTPYVFIIDGKTEVPDPASRAQVEDVHSPSYVVDHKAYPWKTAGWYGRPWHETVIYEAHAGLLGGFKKLEALLPELAELGVTAIELMPLNEFPGARNWGYDGVLLFAPERAYGTPDELKSLVDAAHSLGLMIFVDVVYNHFGPDGNYLGQYAKGFFREDIHTPWGAAIDFRRPQVRDFFIENALMWVLDYRIDGLRLDAVHAISEKDFLTELAERIRAATPTRHVHLMLENEDNSASLLTQGFNAQWNDDGHNILHTLLTNEHEGYYADFTQDQTQKLARCLREGFIYQGEKTRRGHSRGEHSGHLPPTSFILFLQNHDQVGNRAFGERLSELADENALKVATTLLILSPMIPMLFMGEEWGSSQPFLYFTDHHDELARVVCEGRRNEFADFAIFSDEKVRAKIPDPNALGTFTNSMLDYPIHTNPHHQHWRQFYQELLTIRRTDIVPRLPDAMAAGARVLADGAVSASWKMGDGSYLRMDINLSAADLDA